MAIIKCPECSKEVSDKAAHCPGCGYPLTLQTNANQNSQNISISQKVSIDGIPRKYANFWLRTAAWLIDSVILFIGIVVITLSVGEVNKVWPPLNGLLLFPTTITWIWLYYAIQESGYSQSTFGKSILRLKVVDSEFGKISFATATKRFLSKTISGAILLVGYLMMLGDEKGQTLHDKMAKTFVIVD